MSERKRLTLELPADVWERLRIEAAADGLSIGAHVRGLVIARDRKRHEVSGNNKA